MEERELLTIQEMAEWLKVPLSWLYSRTRIKGPDGIPHVRVGHYIRFDPAMVLAWIEGKYGKQLQ